MKRVFTAMIILVLSLAVSSHAKSEKSAVFKISTKGDQLAFDRTSFSVKSNQPVKLTLKNEASKTSGLQHNWVLVKPGTADKVAAESIGAGATKGWIADSPDIVAHTKLVNPGESETIEFKAPADPGNYQFLCTFPGHGAVMKGSFLVK